MPGPGEYLNYENKAQLDTKNMNNTFNDQSFERKNFSLPFFGPFKGI